MHSVSRAALASQALSHTCLQEPSRLSAVPRGTASTPLCSVFLESSILQSFSDVIIFVTLTKYPTKAPGGRRALFWLIVLGYFPSWQGGGSDVRLCNADHVTSALRRQRECQGSAPFLLCMHPGPQPTDRAVEPGALLALRVGWVFPLHLVQRRLFGESRCCRADTTNPHTSVCISEETLKRCLCWKEGKK